MIRPVLLALALAVPAVSAAQQRSPSYTFLQAVRDEDGTKVTEILQQPGQTIVNTKDYSTGEAALHIVARKSNATYLRFLLARGANPNIQDGQGNTAAMIAAERGWADGIEVLKLAKANMNLGNGRGETPLIRAVQTRNLDLAKKLLKAGANPDQADRVAGMSARDYAKQDSRSPALTKLLVDTPKATTRGVSGPKL